MSYEVFLFSVHVFNKFVVPLPLLPRFVPPCLLFILPMVPCVQYRQLVIILFSAQQFKCCSAYPSRRLAKYFACHVYPPLFSSILKRNFFLSASFSIRINARQSGENTICCVYIFFFVCLYFSTWLTMLVRRRGSKVQGI